MPDVFNYSVRYKYTTYKMRNSARCIQLFGKGINILHITGATVAWCIQLYGKDINILHIKYATVVWCIQLIGKGINILHIKCATVARMYSIIR